MSKDPVGAAIFEGHVDFDMGLTTSVSARLGKPFFNKCFTKFNQEIPLNLKSHGNAYVSVKAKASNVRIERRPENSVKKTQKAQSRTLDLSIIKDFDKLTPPDGIDDGLKPFLVFKIDFQINAMLKNLHIDYIHVGKCDIRFGGLRVFSYCGLIKKAINNQVKQIASDMNEMHAPTILEQIEKIFKTRELLILRQDSQLIREGHWMIMRSGKKESIKTFDQRFP